MQQRIYSYVLTFLALLLLSATPLLAQLQPATLRQIQTLLNEKESRTPVQRKISSQLLQATREFQGLKMASGVDLDSAKVKADKRGIVEVDITATVTEELLGKIRELGARIIYASPQYKAIRAAMILTKVETVAGFKEVTFIQPAVEAITVGSDRRTATAKRPSMQHAGMNMKNFIPVRRPTFAERSDRVKKAIEKYMLNNRNFNIAGALAGSVTSEGDATHRADEARNRFGYLGQGIRIGVISDSYNSLGDAPADVASGDLPGPGNPIGNTIPVTVMEDIAGGSDEGRAMLQIVHDLAPKAELFFATAFVSEAGFATNIQALRNAPYNCDIIIDDIIYFDEPVFQDGIVAQAVNSVTASGGLYFSSAGNEGSKVKNTSGVWEGDFNDAGSLVFAGSTKPGTIHNFGTAGAPVNGDIITASGSIYTLNWADPAGASENDYDLFLVSAAGVVKGASTNIQNGTQNPIELLGVPALVAGDRLVVFKAASAAVRAFHLNTVRGRLSVSTSGQTFGHSVAVDAFGVAATPADLPLQLPTPNGPFPGPFVSTNQVETFSSDGPRRVFFNADSTPVTPGNFLFSSNGGNVRNKPDITAADGVVTTLDPNSGLNPFYGTSAAAPHAGAIAALLKSANPAITPAQIRTLLTSTALDIESAGYDNVSGAGIVQAFQAMQALNPQPLAAIALGTVTATETNFSNNNGLIDPGELGRLVVQLNNPSGAPATSVIATLTSTTPGVTITRSLSSYGAIAGGGSVSNTAIPFAFGVNRSVPCGTVINFYVNVTFGGGASPVGFAFTITTGNTLESNITSTLGTTPPVTPDYTPVTGIQTGRLSRDGIPSSCGILKTNIILAATTGARAYDAFTFTNQSPSGTCATVRLSSANGINLYAVAYNDSGFVPANPTRNYAGDAGLSGPDQEFSFDVPFGKKFTVVVHAVAVGAAVGTAYTLNVKYNVCAPPPACSPVTIGNATIANGATGSPYAQSFSASGGSGSGAFSFVLSSNLPAGLTFAGSTLRGTPTQAGSFPIAIVATDPAGCTSDTNYYTLVIAGNPPTSVAATYGTPQSTYPTTTFAQVLQATVRDAANNPLPGVKVIFTAPSTGASGRFSSGLLTDTVITNSIGVAVSDTFTANAIAGSYNIVASVNGIPPASFNLTNFCPASYVVTSSADSGPGSLREVLGLVCPGVTVTFDQSINYIGLTSGQLLVSRGVNIIGPGAGRLTISGNDLFRVFRVTAGTGTVNISGITITGGVPGDVESFGGGGILVTSGIVNVSGCVITNNDASLTFFGEGGGIDNEGGTVSVDKSTVFNNTSYEDGGGITNYSGSMRITNSTITANRTSAFGVGGGIYVNAPLVLTNNTIFGNTAQFGGNIYRSLSTITFRNTIIAGGRLIGTGGTGPDIFGTGFTSANFNLIENTAAGTITGATSFNLTGVSPNLLPLGSYNSETPVLLPRSNSPVINNGDSALGQGLDQRNLARLIGRRADIGSVEAYYIFVAWTGYPQLTPTNQAFILPLQAKVVESGIAVAGDSVFFLAPASGPSGTFPGSTLSAVAVTNSAGLATSPVFTANSIAGRYNVTGRIGTEFSNVNFDLTNLAGGALPVVFGSMAAKAVNCEVQLQWKTVSEQNARDFTIEYSRDGVLFTSLATMQAKGSGTTSKAYSYTHTAPAQGMLYYRIRQTDINGAYTLGEVMPVNNSCSRGMITAYPNPVKETLIVQVSGSGRQVLKLHDVLGREMLRKSVSAGRHELNVMGLAKGMYTLTVTQEGKVAYTLKVIKE